jgi:hypothetical protein
MIFDRRAAGLQALIRIDVKNRESAQKYNYRKYCGSQHQNHPLEIITLEPSREMQNQDYDCDNVKDVKGQLSLPRNTTAPVMPTQRNDT